MGSTDLGSSWEWMLGEEKVDCVRWGVMVGIVCGVVWGRGSMDGVR